MLSFHPAQNIETKQLVWSLHKNNAQVKTNDEPEVQSSAFYATLFADAYTDDVKPFSLPA